MTRAKYRAVTLATFALSLLAASCGALIGAEWEGTLRADAGAAPADAATGGDGSFDAPSADATTDATESDAGSASDGSIATDADPDARVPSGAVASAVAAGEDHTCAIADGGILCWGGNAIGQLGNGSTTTLRSSDPVSVIGIASGATAIAATFSHTCAIVGADMECWGWNSHGQLGTGTITPDVVYSPALVQGLGGTPTAIAVGWGHSCAVVGGGVKCWGSNKFGQVGNGTASSSDVLMPAQVQGLTSGVTAIAASFNDTCAIVNGALKCWGGNGGQLGNKNVSHSSVPVDVFGLSSGVIAVSPGVGFTCAVLSTAINCWGQNDLGGLGDPGTTSTLQPIPVATLGAGGTAIGANGHACALINGGVKCWGAYPGDGTATSGIAVSTGMGLSQNVTAIGVGKDHACAIKDGAVWCWGSNTMDKLGVDNSKAPQGEALMPVRVVF